jgi:hypothetical protein
MRVLAGSRERPEALLARTYDVARPGAHAPGGRCASCTKQQARAVNEGAICLMDRLIAPENGSHAASGHEGAGGRVPPEIRGGCWGR